MCSGWLGGGHVYNFNFRRLAKCNFQQQLFKMSPYHALETDHRNRHHTNAVVRSSFARQVCGR